MKQATITIENGSHGAFLVTVTDDRGTVYFHDTVKGDNGTDADTLRTEMVDRCNLWNLEAK